MEAAEMNRFFNARAPGNKRAKLAKAAMALAVAVLAGCAASGPRPDREATVQVSGMVCDHCSEVVGGSLTAIPGVTWARADYKTGRARVRYRDAATSTATLLAAVNGLGYQTAETSVTVTAM